MYSIYKKEIASFFNSLIAYIVIGIFLIGVGLYIWIFPDTILDFERADLSPFFQSAPFVFIFLIPGITMRMFAEEKNNGTIELLLTKPLNEWEIVLGKYLAAVTLCVVALIPTGVYFVSIYLLGDPVGNIDVASVVGSYLGLILLGCVYTGVGILTSSLTKNQIIAFALAAFICLFLFEGIDYLTYLFDWTGFAFIITKLSLSQHYIYISKGVVDSRDVLYFLSLSLLFLLSTRLVLLSRKW